MILYHGTTKKFDHFDLTHLGEGEGKSKFGVGHYASSVYDTAALYAGKCKGETKYVYSLEVPDLTYFNHIVSTKPPHQVIIEKVEEQFGQIPDDAKSSGKSFRKYIGNLLLGNKCSVALHQRIADDNVKKAPVITHKQNRLIFRNIIISYYIYLCTCQKHYKSERFRNDGIAHPVFSIFGAFALNRSSLPTSPLGRLRCKHQ